MCTSGLPHVYLQYWTMLCEPFSVADDVIPDALCDTLCREIDREQEWMPTSDVKNLPIAGVWSAAVALVQVVLPQHLKFVVDMLNIRKSLPNTIVDWHNDRPLVGTHIAIVFLNDVEGGELEILGPVGVSKIAARRGRLVVLDVRCPHRVLLLASDKYCILIPASASRA